MKRSELKAIIKEVVTQLNPSKQWDADGYEVEVDGKTYFVNANFEWDVESVDYQFDPRRGQGGQGRDLRAEVPQHVIEIEAFGEDDQPVTDPNLLKKIEDAVFDEFTNSDSGVRGHNWDKWM